MTAILGYAPVSTLGQDLDAQLAVLSAAGVDPSRVFTDKLSGSAKTARPGLAAMLDCARDTVVVAAIDRLCRSVAEVTRTIADLGDRRITLRALREGVDTGTPTGRAVAAVMATSPNWSLNWAASAAPHPVIRGAAEACWPLSRRSFLLIDNSSYSAWPPPENHSRNSPQHSESGGRPRTAI
jgi:hypothetical protein